MKIAVVDDERPARSELIHQISELLPEAEISEADSGVAALELLGRETFDILFLDINLNDMEGTTLAAAAHRMLPDARIVFATAYSEYAVKAFELGVDDYILKPFDPMRLRQVLEQCIRRREAAYDIREGGKPGMNGGSSLRADRLAVSSNRKTIFLDISQIAYIETCGRSCIIHAQSGDYIENLLLGDYEKKLAPYGFFRIHKSYLVNLNTIAELFPWASNSLALKMRGFEKEILPVSRDKVRQLRQLLGLS